MALTHKEVYLLQLRTFCPKLNYVKSGLIKVELIFEVYFSNNLNVFDVIEEIGFKYIVWVPLDVVCVCVFFNHQCNI